MKKMKMNIIGAALIGGSLMIACSGQEELLAIKAKQIDSAQVMLEELKTQKEALALANDDLMTTNDSLESALRKLKYDKEANEELIDKRLREIVALEHWAEQTEALQEELVEYGMKTFFEDGHIRLTLDEGLLFSLGSAEISERGQMLIGRLGDAVAQMEDAELIIEGHTDNIPIDGDYSNWDLSVERSMAVASLLINEHKVSPEKLMVAGKSKYDPTVMNTNEVMRAENRRVEFIIVPDLDYLMEEIDEQ